MEGSPLGGGPPGTEGAAAELEGAGPRTIEERIAAKAERVHVLTGAVCNNNCVFCMEEDRDERYVVNSQTDDAMIRSILAERQGAEEICFTSGEPTTNPRLPIWVRWAKEARFRRISVMTNGRSLSYERYARTLAAAGMNRFYVSIHGHTEKLHETLTRTPESFAQTVGGLDQIAKLKRHGVELHTSTVVTKRNLPHVADIYRFLRGHGVDQVVFNVMQANGRAHTNFEHIFPRDQEIAATFGRFLEDQMRLEAQPMAFLVDIPLCTTERIPDFNRGYVEAYVHYEPMSGAQKVVPAERLLARKEQHGGRDVVAVQRADLDVLAREKRAECRTCRHDARCEGVWKNYLARFGWDEMQPIPSPDAVLADVG